MRIGDVTKVSFDIIVHLKNEVIDVNIEQKLDCSHGRNAVFQKKLVQLIDTVINDSFEKKWPHDVIITSVLSSKSSRDIGQDVKLRVLYFFNDLNVPMRF